MIYATMASSSSSSSPEIHHVPTHNTTRESVPFQLTIDDEVLEELSSRFILNLPDEELASAERVCFQVEQAHWYYEDFIREKHPRFPSLPLKKFSAQLFAACPLLRQWSYDHEQTFNTFMQYKTRVPVCGAIMLNDRWDKCVLVKGWKSSSGWGFPKGKINQDEPPHECAIREVLEETGFNLASRLRASDYIEMTIREQRITLYVVGGIPEDYPFQTRTRKEISKIEWFSLMDLPTWRKNKQSSGKFYLITPFVPQLKEFVKVNKPTRRRQRRGSANVSADLSVHTDFEIEKEEAANNVGREPFMAVRLDRDAHGSSSSSADNNDPSTPSPLSVQAMPVVVEAKAEIEAGMDPHFSRLLASLSSSASKALVHEESELTNNVASAPSLRSQVDSASLPASSSTLNVAQSCKADAVATVPSVPSHPPTPPDHADQPSPSAPIDRRLKHLALLESVANESNSMSSLRNQSVDFIQGPQLLRNIPPVPAHAVSSNSSYSTRFDTRSIPPHGSGNVGPPPPPMRNVQPLNRPTFPATKSDPFTVRPMTSNAVLPPSLSPKRHGPNMSMHQGHLLNLLGGPSGPVARFAPQYQPHTFNGMLQGQAPPPPPQPQFNGIPSQAPAPHLLRVVPPPPGMFASNPGPLTAPISGPNTNSTPMGSMQMSAPPPPQRAQHLLSLLNPNNTAHAIPNLTADATRPNYLTGSPAVQVPFYPHFSAVSNNISHRQI